MGKDLRTNKRSQAIILRIKDQPAFDELFAFLFHHERPLVMRTADAIEKITRTRAEFLQPHKAHLFSLLKTSDHIELKWHIAQLLPRVTLLEKEREQVWNTLHYWALNPNESKIVRVNALQGLYDLSLQHPELKEQFMHTLNGMEHEPIPSIQARIRKLRKLSR